MAEIKMQRNLLRRLQETAREIELLSDTCEEFPALPAEVLEATVDRHEIRVSCLVCEMLGLDYKDERLRQRLWSALLGSVDVEELLAEHGVEIVTPED
jgi:hypothetical protein